MRTAFRDSLVIILMLLAVTASIVGLTYANYRYVVNNPGGNDFLTRWVGTQELIFNGTSPYADSVAERIQEIAYGRPTQSGEDEMLFAYPIYASLFHLPFALIRDFSVARALWMTTLEISVILLAAVSIQLTRWKPGTLGLIIFFAFSLLWYHSARPIILGNAAVLVALFVTLAFLAIRQGRDDLAGILLGFATIKPQVVLLLWVFITIWAFSRQRWKILLWSYGTVIVLSVIGLIFVPDWITQNFYQVLQYPNYTPPGTPSEVFMEWLPGVGRQLGWALTAVLGITLLIEWVSAWGKEFEWFLWTACLTMTISQWIGLQTDPGNFIILFFPLIYVIVNLENRWGKGAKVISIGILLLLFFGLWFLFLATLQVGDQPMQNPVMFFPLPFVILIGLYWVRWWATRPRRPLAEALKVL